MCWIVLILAAPSEVINKFEYDYRNVCQCFSSKISDGEIYLCVTQEL